MANYDRSQKDWQAKAGSYDRCPKCGVWKAKKASHCRSCSPNIRGSARWKDNPSPGAGRTRARNLHALPDKCERCELSVRLERHHIDGDTSNNDRSNIQALCRRCHMEVDGRLEAFKQLPPMPIQPPKPCIECGRLMKPLRRGLCGACNERKRRREFLMKS